MSALLAAEVEQGDQWDAFWSADTYIVRCTRASGGVEWFTVSDEEATVDLATKAAERRQRAGGTRVLEFPLRRLQTRVVIAKGPDGREMMVGTARRTDRKIVRRGGA